MPKKENEKEEDFKASFDSERVMGVIAYLGPLSLVPLFLKERTALIRHHTKQGLVLFIFELILGVIVHFPLLGWLVAFFGWIFAVFLAAMGIINGAAKKFWKMPVLGKYGSRLDPYIKR